MRQVFADTLYWGALLHPHDQFRTQAMHVRSQMESIQLVTTDEVLAELLDGLSHRGPLLRKAGAETVRTILGDRCVTVHPQTRTSFMAGLRLYEKRLDKGYSLVDCVSMTVMRRLGITTVLTNDHHFAQEGFRILL